MTRDVRKVVHHEPRGFAFAAQLDGVRPLRLEVYRLRRENPSGTGAQIPRQHDVPFDEAQGHVIGGRIVSNVHHQGDLVHEIGHELHGQLETLVDFGRYGVRGVRRESADAAREKRFADLEI